jgi:hypothetical protein
MTFPAPVPEIPAANVGKAAAYYVNTLGFTFDWGTAKAGIAGISRGELPAVYHQSLLPRARSKAQYTSPSVRIGNASSTWLPW